MLIRCERCQALYSLQDGVVKGATASGGGFAVECGRCELVFAAKIPQGKAPPSGGPARPPSVKTHQAQPKTTPAKGSAAVERQGGAQPTGDELAKALRPKRPVPVSDPESFEKLLAAKARTRRNLVIALCLVALVGLGAALTPVIKKKLGGLPAAAQAKLEKARQKLLLDDAQSLEQAVALLGEAARMAPGEAGPEGERAFALLVQAGAHKDLADRLEAAAREQNDKIAKLQLEKPEGWELQVKALVEQVTAIAAEREPHAQAAQRLLSQGLSVAKAALEEDPEEASANRALALYQALNDAGERGLRLIDKAEQQRPGEVALNAWVRSQLQMCGAPSRDKQQKGLEQLAIARQAEPKLLRALYDQAAVEVERQLAGPAREKLTTLLKENPQHERAKKLLAALPAAQ